MKDLAVEVGYFDCVAVYEANSFEACAGEISGCWTSEAACSYYENGGGMDSHLAFVYFSLVICIQASCDLPPTPILGTII